MSNGQQKNSFTVWLDAHMKKGGADVPARLVVVMALLERLRQKPSLEVGEHVSKSGMQLEEHNHFAALALDHFKITSPVREWGRRSSNLQAWIEPLFDWLKSCGYDSVSTSEQQDMLRDAQSTVAQRLEIINQGKPLIARFNKGTARAVIADVLDQAQEKKRAKDVAEYLVGAKLQLRLGEAAATPKNVNTPNRNQPADFPIGSAAIEVTVNPADSRHLSQIQRILKDTTWQVWLLVRLRDREKWQNVVDASLDEQLAGRVVITDIETFVGQNISEIGAFDETRVVGTLSKLFELYNERWLPEAGTSGLRIVSGNPDAK